jgi:C1A family cysteine protease
MNKCIFIRGLIIGLIMLLVLISISPILSSSLNNIGADSEVESDCNICDNSNSDFGGAKSDFIEPDCDNCYNSNSSDFGEYGYGLIEPDNWFEEAVFEDIQPTSNLPPAWDWRSQSGCHEIEIRNQGNCGSCWAFATVAPLEYNIKIKDGVTVDLSEQWLLSCNTKGYSCSGGWFVHGHHYNEPGLCGGVGAVYENEAPYTGTNGNCQGPYNHPYVIDSWAYIGSHNTIPSVDQIKQAIYTYGPVSVAVVAGSAFQSYNGGLFNTNEGGNVNHAVVLVGWDENYQGHGVWILRNSWGTNWGDNGYMYITYGTSQVGYAACFVNYHGSNYVEMSKYADQYESKDDNWKTASPTGSMHCNNYWSPANNDYITYKFTIPDLPAKDLYLGVEFKASGVFWNNGPDLEAKNQNTGLWVKIKQSMGKPSSFVWAWYGVSNAYISSSGVVELRVLASAGCHAHLYHVAIRYTPPPTPKLDASCSPNPLTWTQVEPGDTKTGTITVKNVGDIDSFLNWEVKSGYPSWITCSKTSGTGLPKGSTDTITLTVFASDKGEDTRSGKIRLVNSDDPTDFKEFTVSITTKKSLSFQQINPFISLLGNNQLFENLINNLTRY